MTAVLALTLSVVVLNAVFAIGGNKEEIEKEKSKSVSSEIAFCGADNGIELGRTPSKDEVADEKNPATAGQFSESQQQEDYENEKIEEALLEQNYLSDEIPLDYDTQACLKAWCEEYSVPYQLALGVIEAESSFTADASNGSCYGYMQINSINEDWLEDRIGVLDIKDPLQNLHSGVYMLGNLYEKYEDWSKVLVCYNCGEKGAYDHYFSQGLVSSGYSRHVLELEKKWEKVVER